MSVRLKLDSPYAQGYADFGAGHPCPWPESTSDAKEWEVGWMEARRDGATSPGPDGKIAGSPLDDSGESSPGWQDRRLPQKRPKERTVSYLISTNSIGLLSGTAKYDSHDEAYEGRCLSGSVWLTGAAIREGAALPAGWELLTAQGLSVPDKAQVKVRHDGSTVLMAREPAKG
jgi:hypothetical protein